MLSGVERAGELRLEQFTKREENGQKSQCFKKTPLNPPEKICLLLLSHPACLFHNLIRLCNRNLKRTTGPCCINRSSTADVGLSTRRPTSPAAQRLSSTNRWQRGMAASSVAGVMEDRPVPLRGSRHFVPRA
jgi:hypothetical protein